ncbi:MAG: ABC transporter ATP-binding protein [Candidatus Nanopelagicales bacterium]
MNIHWAVPDDVPDPAMALDNVWVQYKLRNAHHYNLKRTISNALTRRKEEPEIIAALCGVTLVVPKGARVGLAGPNGAGKSTLLSVMAGVLKPTRGTATTYGRVLALLGGPNEGLDPEQTGRENAVALGVRLGESVSRMHERIDDIKDFSGLGKRFDHPVYTYSSGMQVRLRFTTITSVRADVLIVDEGIGAADAEFNARADERLAQFYADSGTLVLASHAPDVLEKLCTSVLHVENGEVRPA